MDPPPTPHDDFRERGSDDPADYRDRLASLGVSRLDGLALQHETAPPSPPRVSRYKSPRGALAHGLDGWDSPPLVAEPAPAPGVRALELDGPLAPSPPRQHISPRGPLAHGLDGWNSPPLEPDRTVRSTPQGFALDAPLATMPTSGSKRSEAPDPGELEGGCPVACVTHKTWFFGCVLAGVFAVLYFTGAAARASTPADEEEEKRRERYERPKPDDEASAAAADDKELDTVAVVFLAASLLFGVYGLYVLCSRPKENAACTLPTQ